MDSSNFSGAEKLKRRIDAACLQSGALYLVMSATPSGGFEGLFFA